MFSICKFAMRYASARNPAEVLPIPFATHDTISNIVHARAPTHVACGSPSQSLPACTVGYVEDEATLVGFSDDDVCVDKFA